MKLVSLPHLKLIWRSFIILQDWKFSNICPMCDTGISIDYTEATATGKATGEVTEFCMCCRCPCLGVTTILKSFCKFVTCVCAIVCDGVENGCAAKYGDGLVSPKDIHDEKHRRNHIVNTSDRFIINKQQRSLLERFFFMWLVPTRKDRVCFLYSFFFCIFFFVCSFS